MSAAAALTLGLFIGFFFGFLACAALVLSRDEDERAIIDRQSMGEP